MNNYREDEEVIALVCEACPPSFPLMVDVPAYNPNNSPRRIYIADPLDPVC